MSTPTTHRKIYRLPSPPPPPPPPPQGIFSGIALRFFAEQSTVDTWLKIFKIIPEIRISASKC